MIRSITKKSKASCYNCWSKRLSTNPHKSYDRECGRWSKFWLSTAKNIKKLLLWVITT